LEFCVEQHGRPVSGMTAYRPPLALSTAWSGSSPAIIPGDHPRAIIPGDHH